MKLKLLLDVKSFREGGYYYVDKTMLARTLMERGGENFMLFRPHGFGKSLVADVLEMTQLYVCRRQIGLPTRKVPVVEALPLSSIMTFLRLCRRVPQSRWASLFDTESVHVLTLAARTARTLARHLEPVLPH